MSNGHNWCRHFTGIQNDTCKAGITYMDVRTNDSPARFPCVDTGCRHLCAKFEPFTAEEIEEDERRVVATLAHLNDFMHRRREDCPHCGKHVESMKQVGRCVYLSCGCRGWQGSVPKEWKTNQA